MFKVIITDNEDGEIIIENCDYENNRSITFNLNEFPNPFYKKMLELVVKNAKETFRKALTKTIKEKL